MRERFVHVTSRLAAALSMLEQYSSVADIGCDHGRLTAALLQKGVCRFVVASDISEASLEKAKRLIRQIGFSESVSFRVGDGCSVLKPGECDAIVLLGMGGTLMTRILEACPVRAMDAKALILQPMRAQDDIRAYLHRNRYRIEDDRVVSDHGRLYQVLKAVPSDCVESLPAGFPNGFYDVGYRAFEKRDTLLPVLCRQQLTCHEKMLKSAAGSEGEKVLLYKINALHQILDAFDKEESHDHT